MAENVTGCKVFTATMAKQRESLGETVTHWLKANRGIEVIDKVVVQSSDAEFHCVTIVIWYR